MDDRFDCTQREAKAAIDRARTRGSAAHDRRREIEERIADLDGPAPPQRPATGPDRLAEARERAAKARESSERARRRAAEARRRIL